MNFTCRNFLFSLSTSACILLFFMQNTFANVQYWTGHFDRFTYTLKLDETGKGMYCQDSLGNISLVKVKKVKDSLYTEDGSNTKIVEKSNTDGSTSLYVYGATLQKDDTLQMSSQACRDILTKNN